MKLSVASPCRESWDRMRGDDRVRACERCSLRVYNLSSMREEEAEELVRRTEGRLCVRFHQRLDGTVMTEDCPVGRHERSMLRLSWATAAALLLGVFVSLAGGLYVSEGRAPAFLQKIFQGLRAGARQVQGEVTMGKPAPPR